MVKVTRHLVTTDTDLKSNVVVQTTQCVGFVSRDTLVAMLGIPVDAEIHEFNLGRPHSQATIVWSYTGGPR